MKKILFIGQNSKSASFRFRAKAYFNLFAEEKIKCDEIFLSGSLMNNILLIFKLRKYDVLFIQRKLFPIFYFSIIRFLAKKIVFDFDDSIFIRSNNTQSSTRLKRFKFACRKSDLIFAGNKFLFHKSKKLNNNSHLIPTCVETNLYYKNSNKKNFNLVWIGSRSTSKYLLELLPEIENAAKKIKNLTLVNISDVKIKSKNLKILNKNWNEKKQYSYLSKGHIGLAPLSNDVWSKGKCSLKVIQYIASNLPVVSSNIGNNKEILKNFKYGYLAKRKGDWSRYINEIKNAGPLNKDLFKKFIENYDRDKMFKKINYLLLK